MSTLAKVLIALGKAVIVGAGTEIGRDLAKRTRTNLIGEDAAAAATGTTTAIQQDELVYLRRRTQELENQVQDLRSQLAAMRTQPAVLPANIPEVASLPTVDVVKSESASEGNENNDANNTTNDGNTTEA